MTDPWLTDVDIRVLGSLIEKGITTPDSYPLSLNALVNACNQSSNRHPVVAFDDATVSASIDHLRRESLVRGIQRSDSRVTKYHHLAAEALSLSAAEIAVMCTLMLRGPQTGGEIKTRSGRLFDFASLADVEATLTALVERPAGPLVARLPRQPGQKEGRYGQLLAGDITFDAPDAVVITTRADGERIGALEETLNDLQKEVSDLRSQLETFRKQFE